MKIDAIALQNFSVLDDVVLSDGQAFVHDDRSTSTARRAVVGPGRAADANLCASDAHAAPLPPVVHEVGCSQQQAKEEKEGHDRDEYPDGHCQVVRPHRSHG